MSRLFSNLPRILFFPLFLFSAWYLPLWLTAVVFLLGVCAFDWFFEGVLVLLSVDAVFASGWLPAMAVSGVSLLLFRELFVYYLRS